MWPGEHFSRNEMCRPTMQVGCPSDAWACIGALVGAILDPLRKAHGGPLHVTSGFRSKEYNEAIGGAQESQHVDGAAADLQSDMFSPERLAALVISEGLPYDQLIVERRSDGRGWVHVSYGPRHRRQALQCLDGRNYTPWRP